MPLLKIDGDTDGFIGCWFISCYVQFLYISVLRSLFSVFCSYTKDGKVNKET